MRDSCWAFCSGVSDNASKSALRFQADMDSVIRNKPYSFRISIKSITSDKNELLALTRELPSEEAFKEYPGEGLPADRYASESSTDAGWVTFEEPIFYA